MSETILYIKNMVCPRCITAIEDSLNDSYIEYNHVELGKIYLDKIPEGTNLSIFNKKITQQGFELIEEKNDKIVNQIKVLVIKFIRTQNTSDQNLSTYLSEQLHTDYSLLSKRFSDIGNTTIEKYYIQQKIEYVKELLTYNESNLSEIADKLKYSSVAYLSKQFKEITHQTPTQYLKSEHKNRITLDKI